MRLGQSGRSIVNEFDTSLSASERGPLGQTCAAPRPVSLSGSSRTRPGARVSAANAIDPIFGARGADRRFRGLPPRELGTPGETNVSLRRSLADFCTRNIVLATNLGMMAIVTIMSVLVMILPFGEPANALISAAVTCALALTGSRWWHRTATGTPPAASTRVPHSQTLDLSGG